MKKFIKMIIKFLMFYCVSLITKFYVVARGRYKGLQYGTSKRKSEI